MQEINVQKRCGDNIQPLDFKYSLNEIYQKNFLRGLQNARNLLANLEHSIHKSHKYQDKLFRCRATHKHAHDFDDWFFVDTDFSDEKEVKSSKAKLDREMNLSQLQAPVNLTESWSTMSIVCLQYQYEELAKRYEGLLKAFNDKCTEIASQNTSLTQLRQEARTLHAQLTSAHRTLLSVGEKYLALKKRKLAQQQYEKKVQFLKERVRDVLTSAEKARLHLDSTISQSMALERDAEYAMLLAEMRKCNRLFLENLRLKARLEEFVPSAAKWT